MKKNMLIMFFIFALLICQFVWWFDIGSWCSLPIELCYTHASDFSFRDKNNNKAEADAIDNQDNLMLINATIEEIHDDYLMVSCTNSPKMIKVIYSKNNLSNFKEKQKIAIFFASTNTSTLSGVRIKILE